MGSGRNLSGIHEVCTALRGCLERNRIHLKQAPIDFDLSEEKEVARARSLLEATLITSCKTYKQLFRRIFGGLQSLPNKLPYQYKA